MTENQLRIKTAEPGDLPALLELYRQLHPVDPTVSPADAVQTLQEFLSYPGSAIFIGLEEHRFVTSCALIVVPNLTRGGRRYALIENVITDKEHRRRGYGREILRAAIAAAWKLDCYKVMLLTGSNDPATLAFYKTAGFEQSKTGFQIRRD